MEREAVTTAAGVPTIWTGLLAYLRETGARLTHTRRLLVAGSAVPTSLIRAFRDEYDVTLQPAWGMTETNPAGTVGGIVPAGLDRKDGEEGKRVSVRVDLGGRRTMSKKNKHTNILNNTTARGV